MLQDLRAGEGGVFLDPDNVSAPVVGRQWDVMHFLHGNTEQHVGLGHPSPVHHFKFTRNEDGRAMAHFRDTDEDSWQSTDVPFLKQPVVALPLVPKLDDPAPFPEASTAKIRKLVEEMPSDMLWKTSWDAVRDSESWNETLSTLDSPNAATCNLSWPSGVEAGAEQEISPTLSDSDTEFDAELRAVLSRNTTDRPSGNFAVGRAAAARFTREGRMVRAAKKARAAEQLRGSPVKTAVAQGEYVWCEMDAETGQEFGHEHGSLYLGQARQASCNGAVTLRWYRNWEGSEPATVISRGVTWRRWMHQGNTYTADTSVDLNTLARDEAGIISFQTLTLGRKLRAAEFNRVWRYLDANDDGSDASIDE